MKINAGKWTESTPETEMKSNAALISWLPEWVIISIRKSSVYSLSPLSSPPPPPTFQPVYRFKQPAGDCDAMAKPAPRISLFLLLLVAIIFTVYGVTWPWNLLPLPAPLSLSLSLSFSLSFSPSALCTYPLPSPRPWHSLWNQSNFETWWILVQERYWQFDSLSTQMWTLSGQMRFIEKKKHI